MLSIGDFARRAGVSVRMLRHYDRLGLLVPTRVDEFTGYRFYRADQLGRVNRLVALKDLGFTLEQVGQVLDGRLNDRQLHHLLTTRRDELAAQIAGDRLRLHQVEARLRSIEKENTMSHNETRLTSLPALQVAQLSVTLTEGQSVGEVVSPLFGRVAQLVASSGAQRRGPDIGHYGDDSGAMTVAAAAQLALEDTPPGLVAATLASVEHALVATYTGAEIDGISDAWQDLAREVEARGLTPVGPCREVYLQTPYDGDAGWVVELQQPLA